MEIKRSAYAQGYGATGEWLPESRKDPAEYFTGTVRIDPLFEAPESAGVRGASVTFEAGARAAWRTHPLGQTLTVTSGVGRVRR